MNCQMLFCSSDLSVGLVTVMSDLIWKITVNFYGGDVLCKLVKFAQVKLTGQNKLSTSSNFP